MCFFGNKGSDKEKVKKSGVNVVTWNIAGFAKIKEAWEFLEEKDIIIVQETWLEQENEEKKVELLNNNYMWATKAAVRENKKGRAKGGLIVGIKKTLKELQVKEWKYGLVIDGLKTGDRDIKMIAGYNNSGMSEFLDKMSEIIDEAAMEGKELVIVGDLNARIGVNNNENNEKDEIERKSEDLVYNTEGKKLIQFCRDKGLEVKNGKTEGDWEGKLTYVGRGGAQF